MTPFGDIGESKRNDRMSEPSVKRADSVKVEARKCRLGTGVFAKSRIEPGEFIAGFYGRVFPADKASLLPRKFKNHVIQFSEHLWRDSIGLARFLNHSCEPNCYVRGDFDIVTLRAIAPEEELTWDYSTTENSDWIVPGGKCLCFARTCRGTIAPFRALAAHEKRAIETIVGSWLRHAEESQMHSARLSILED